MLLSDKRIVEELHNGNIIIEPFDQRQLGTNSYDCRLGKWYFQGDMNVDIIHLDNPHDIRRYWGQPREAADGKIAIRPGTTILAHTIEVIGGHNGYLAKMNIDGCSLGSLSAESHPFECAGPGTSLSTNNQLLINWS